MDDINPTAGQAGQSRKTAAAAAAVLTDGSPSRSLRRLLPFFGPAFVACVAYLDPGNFATNIQAGAKFRYLLPWVVVGSNLMAVLIQTVLSHPLWGRAIYHAFVPRLSGTESVLLAAGIRDGVCRLAACLGPLLIVGGNCGWPGHHAGIHPFEG